MNKTIGLQLVIYGLLLAGLSYVVYYLAPVLARPTLITGLAGGTLCLAWGLLAIAGKKVKALSILTLTPVSFALLSQTVIGWTGGSQEVTGRRPAAAVITLLFVLSIGMLMRVAYTGAVFDGRQAGPAKDAVSKSQAAEKPAQANAGRGQRV
jgi:hypothetical protein